MTDSIFLYDLDSYKQDIRPIEHYVEQASLYLHKVKNITLNEAENIIRQGMANKTGPFSQIKDRVIKHAIQTDNGDREIINTSLIKYIDDISKKNVIVAPTLTTYIPHSVKEALSVKFVEKNKKGRSVAKKLKFKYKINNDLVKSSYYDIMQKYLKIINNAFSGAFSSPYTIIYFKTGHNTLTTATRLTTSNSNSLNEKLLTGNRHYYNVDIILENIIFITSQIQKENIVSLVSKYNLYIPTVDDCLELITRSARLYCLYHYEESCLKLLRTLDDYERVWFVYCNDFYYLSIYNKDLISSFLDRITKVISDDEEYVESQVYEYPEEYRMCASQICYSYVRGYGDNYSKMKENGILKIFIPTIRNCYELMQEYSDLFSGFFKNKVAPHSVAYFPNSVRRCILTSDTDSTIPTYQDIIFWYLGKKVFNDKGRATQGFLILLSTYLTSNTLINMSSQFNTDPSRLKDIYMKNEYTFDSYVTTQMTKHYYATISVQEGNAFQEVEREYKGVHLISSNLPKIIVIKAKELMNDIMDKSINNEEISIIEYLKLVKSIEDDIYNSIKRGETTYLKVYKVKDKASYRPEQFNAYNYAELWNQVFANRSASIETFPYQAIKVSVTIDTKKRMESWLSTLDQIARENMKEWIKQTGRQELSMIMLPIDVINSHSIPDDIAKIIDYRKIIKEICKILYTILETIGFYVKNEFIVSDYFTTIESNIPLHLLD